MNYAETNMDISICIAVASAFVNGSTSIAGRAGESAVQGLEDTVFPAAPGKIPRLTFNIKGNRTNVMYSSTDMAKSTLSGCLWPGATNYNPSRMRLSTS